MLQIVSVIIDNIISLLETILIVNEERFNSAILDIDDNDDDDD